MSSMSGIVIASGLSMFTKSAGSIVRVHDDKNAPQPILHDTIKREALTLAQVGLYGAIIKVVGDHVATNIERWVEKNGPAIARKGFNVLKRNQAFLMAVIAFAASILAEVVSRVFAPRDIWKNPDDPILQDALTFKGKAALAQQVARKQQAANPFAAAHV
jgi:hypothetical protein